MKEVRFFYVPNASSVNELPEEEAQHAVRVLRMEMGDEMMLMDGEGIFYRAIVTEATKKRCLYRIEETLPQERQWQPHLHLAMAPTKNMDRTEWFAEKATEIGFDELTFLRCRWSERTVIKTERVEKILVSAMKQSHKAWKPILNEMVDFKAFLQEIKERENRNGKVMQKFICHCYEEEGLGEKVALKDALKSGEDVLVMVGPEGDFSIDEVKMAEANGFQSVSLGKSRLRTETAALVAVHLMNLINQ
ncbi:MAG: 16S rRNA (uracil(1498)-N(3))-methyltransferase [Bacteroidales bacterium]|jgi:16S rRNA (uracil1498-N3)-methyltransferase|nr:16S rRNA (uracil(1498)-N(3))-methyltransferase [Bacteroidaceae bacterium]MDO4202521.1 16S rRNA (uracil(1498)-N(3))-methyltransferase [Bacteroidales bacterium]